MHKINLITIITAIFFVTSCSDTKDGNVVDTENVKTLTANVTEESKYDIVSRDIVNDYLAIKDALVETDSRSASNASKKLVSTLKSFDTNSHATTLTSVINSAVEHAEAIVNSDIDEQRKQFEFLSDDILEIVNKTGTKTTLYQQFCPMYGEDGGVWLSAERNIRNPYFGDKMMTCGKVQQEIK